MFQVILNSIIAGLLLALLAYSFSLIFNVTKVFHLAQASVVATGGLLFTRFHEEFGLITAILGTLILLFLIIGAMEKLVYLPLHLSGANQVISLISSIGINIFIINALSLLFGNEVHKAEIVIPSVHQWQNFTLTTIQMLQLGVSLVILGSLGLYFKISKKIILLKSATDNASLAGVMGIDVVKLRFQVLLIGSVLAAVVGVLLASDTGVDPYTGSFITLSSVVVAILTGTNGLWQIVVVAIGVTILQGFTEWYLSSQWKEGVTFFLFLVVLILRTEGILGYSLRQDR